MFKSLKTKLLWSHIGAVLLVNLLLGLIGYKSLSEYLLSIEVNNLKHNSSHSAEIIKNSLDDLAEDLIHMSSNRIVLDFLDNYRELALQEHLRLFQDKFPKIAILNASGDEEFKLTDESLDEPGERQLSPNRIEQLLLYPNEVAIYATGTDPDLKGLVGFGNVIVSDEGYDACCS